MKKIFKKLFIIILTFTLMLGIANAETISKSFTINSSKYSSTPMSFPQTFRVKKTTTGKYAFCIHYSMDPPSGQTYNKGSLVTDNGMNYILKQAYGTKNNDEFFINQTALWIYMVDKGIMPGDYDSVVTFKKSVNNSSSATATKIKNLVSNAKKASKNDTAAPTISIDGSNITFTLNSDGTKYVSNKITIKSSTKDYKISIDSAPSGTTYEQGDGYIKLIVPADKVTSLITTIKFSVNNTKTIYESYTYTSSDKKHQPVAIPFKNTKTASASASATLTTTKSIYISKQDITTSKELPGATLEVKNANGKIIDTWVSTTTPHLIKGLGEGTYTLTEKIAPEGYVLSTETIKFTIDKNGKITDASGNAVNKIVMYNKPEEKTTDISISKQDIATSKELPGATLEVKDANGKTIDTWVSGTTPHTIKGLGEGTYTLTEKIAPEGYILSTETITFSINKDGKLVDKNGNSIDKIVMYNEKEQPKTGGVSISKQDITNKQELPGATLVLKDYDGNVIDEWTSTDKPHVIENLKPGIYTLNEKVAPNGYILSDETITFTVKDDGSITPVVMYNSPDAKEEKEEIEVENTASFKSVSSTIFGISIILIGFALIFKNKKMI